MVTSNTRCPQAAKESDSLYFTAEISRLTSNDEDDAARIAALTEEVLIEHHHIRKVLL